MYGERDIRSCSAWPESTIRDSPRPEPEVQERTRRVWKTREHCKFERQGFEEISKWRLSRDNGFRSLPSVRTLNPRLERAASEQVLGSGPDKPITIDDSEPSISVDASISPDSSQSLMPPPSLPASRTQRVYLLCSLRLDVVHDGPSGEIRDKLDQLLQIMGDYGRCRLDVDQSVHMRNSVLHICRETNCEFLHRNI